MAFRTLLGHLRHRQQSAPPVDADSEPLVLPEDPGELWLRNKGQFFLALLAKDRSDQKRVGDVLAGYFADKSTSVPDSTKCDPNKMAGEFLELILRPTILTSGMHCAGRRGYAHLQKYLWDNWGYKTDAVSRMRKQLKLSKPDSTPDICLRITQWAETYAGQIVSDANAARLRSKVRMVLRETRNLFAAGEQWLNRYDLLNELWEYGVWKEFTPERSYCIKSRDANKRMTLTVLGNGNGKAELMEPEPKRKALSEWVFESCAQKGSQTQISPMAASWLKLVCTKDDEELGALSLDDGHTDNRWAIFKHCKDDTFAIFDTCNDTVLTCHNALSAVPVTAKAEADDIGCWCIEPFK